MDDKMGLTQLKEAAITLHELFLEFVEVGFTEDQALYLVGKILTNVRQVDES